MATVLERLPSGARVAVIRLRSLGDCVLTTPALALLKQYRPDLVVAVAVEERFRSIFEGNPDIACILCGRGGGPSAVEMFAWRPKLALNLHGGTRSMMLTVASAAPIRAGFAHHRFRFLYSHRIPRAQEILGEERKVHTAKHIASAMFWLGVPRAEPPRARLFVDDASDLPNGAYAVFHPFASEPAKTWPPDRFVAVASECRRAGLEPIFLGGSRDDSSPFARFEVWNGAPLNRVKELLARASLFVGNDSGPAHIAAAFGVPVVALFGPSDPCIWGPWRTPARVLTSSRGIDGISIGEVLEAADCLKVRA